MSTALQKIDPRYTCYLRGFDRRGAAASLSQASATGLTVSGVWSDQVDFAVLVLFDEDDLYSHLQTSKYLPDSNLTGLVLDTDLALANVYAPTSTKFDSLSAGQLSWIDTSGTGHTTPLAPHVTAASGGGYASCLVTINGTPVSTDVFSVGFFGNFVSSATGQTTAINVAAQIEYETNNNAYALWGEALVPFIIANIVGGNFTDQVTLYAGRSAFANTGIGGQPPTQFTFSVATVTITQANLVGSGYDYRQLVGFWGVQVGDPVLVLVSGGVNYERHTVASVTSPWQITLDSAPSHTPTMVLWPMYGQDGNTIQCWLNTNSTGATFTAGGSTGTNLYPKLAGGSELSSSHLHLDFSALSITAARQIWLTFGPLLNVDTSADNQTVKAFARVNWSAVFSSWAVTDPGSIRPLKIAGPGSVIVGSRDQWATYAGSGWAQQVGFYYQGFSQASSHSADAVTIFYSCQSSHGLYLGTTLFSGAGTFSVKLDGTSLSNLNCSDPSISSAAPLNTRRLLSSGVAAGQHSLVLTVVSGACTFDYLHAAIRADVTTSPATTYAAVSAALDYDTDQTYKLPPARTQMILQALGFQGDTDVYAGVFFALTRVRSGGSFHQATVSLAGTLTSGDAAFVDIAGTSIGVAVTSYDTLATLAQRLVNAVNVTFVGVFAEPALTAGQFTLTVLSPINGFSLTVTSGTHLAISFTGDIGYLLSSGGYVGGQEGVWQPDTSLTSPLNLAFTSWLADFCGLLQAAGRTCTVAFSQEILAPPDVNTSSGAWGQRFSSGDQVLTATGFGSWGTGYVESYSAPTVTQTGHGYITGNTAHLASSSGSGVWTITVLTANTYQLTTAVSNSGGYTPSAGDTVFIDLQTTQCNFNPATMTAYMIYVYLQAAGVMHTAGLVPWLQFGEVGWWFFSRLSNTAIGYVADLTPISVGVASPHGFSTGDTVVDTGVQGTTSANGTWPIVVVDSTHFTLTGSSGNGTWVTNTGYVSGGGMAYYDAYTASAAATALGRALANFTCQDSDPSVNSHADANFLRGQLYTHMHAIAAAVLAVYSGAKFEWLLPLDVNYPSVYWNAGYPYAQGGRLNNYVNIPSQYMSNASDISRIKMEALSWGASYRWLDGAKTTMQYPVQVLSWAAADCAYLIPIFNGGCPWSAEYLAGLSAGIPLVNAWALDHIILMSWTGQSSQTSQFLLPAPVTGAQVT